MVRVRSRRRSKTRQFSAILVALSALTISISSRAAVELFPGPRGHLGAWRALGPLNDDPKDRSSFAREKATWRLLASNDGAIDVGAGLGLRTGEAFALLSGVIHLSDPLKGVLFVGASDGIKVTIDGRAAFSNDGRRPARDDQDAIVLDLAAGDHPITITLHHRYGAWLFRARLVDETLAPVPGAWLRLPGITDRTARALAGRLASVKVDFGLAEDGFRPTATIAFPEGLLRDTDRSVRLTAAVNGGQPLFDLRCGDVPTGERGPSDLRVRLPPIGADDLAGAEAAAALDITVETAGKSFASHLPLAPWMQGGLRAANRAMALASRDRSPFLTDPDATRTTIENLQRRLVRDVGAGDPDLEATAADAATLAEYLTDLEQGRDPLRAHAGIRRFAHLSPLDGWPSEFGVYVPPSYDPSSSKTYPLVVILHGLNGKPLSTIRRFFGKDSNNAAAWEDRHPGDVPPIDGFVLAPNAHGNATYRELGEADTMMLLDWAEAFFPIDPARVTITGASMGGIGAAAIPLKYPDRFAAAEPLCGYHSYFVRADIKGQPMLPWERWLAEQRSNTSWAENGLHLPMYVWHGKKDYPEKNSLVLIDRYKALGYKILEEHPNVGHDVWRKAYEDLSGWRWLSAKTRNAHERSIVFRTNSLRWADDGWVHVRELKNDLEFGEIRATVSEPDRIDVTARGVSCFALDRDPALVTASTALTVSVNGQKITFAPDVPIALCDTDGVFAIGERPAPSGHKRPRQSGPIRDIYFDPLIFVYGTLDPSRARANEEVARAWAKVRPGVDVHYPVIPDVELSDQAAASHSLVLVGSARENRIVRDLEPGLPFAIDGDAIVASRDKREWRGVDAGVVFIYPNPRYPDRYVLVIEAPSALGTYRSISVPELLGDFLVYDRSLASARGQVLLGGAKALFAGLFRRDWSLPDP